MRDSREAFPSVPEAFFLVALLFAAELVLGALFRDLKGFSGIDPRDMAGVIAVLASGLLFSLVLHYKRLTYRSLFHASPNSVAATLGTLALPILLIVPGLTLVIGGITDLLTLLFPLSGAQQAMFELMMSNGVASVVTVCLVAPFLEEMLFRGIILRSFLQQYPRRQAMIWSAFLFGLFHLNVYQFAVGWILGLLLAWLYERTRSLWPCILLHAAYNAHITYLYWSAGGPEATEYLDPSPTDWVVAFVLAFAGFSMLRYLLVWRGTAEDGVAP